MTQEEICSVCGKKVEVMAFRKTKVCSENCYKKMTGDTDEARAQVDAGLTNILNQPNGEVNLRGIK